MKKYLPLSSIADRFWGKIRKSAGCWNWQGYRMQQGKWYGMFQARKVALMPMLAHRVAWELTNGPIPPGMCVCHHCDNPACCRPSHLFLGTFRENNEDRTRKGRTAAGDHNGARTHPECVPQGEHNGQSKITAAVVRKIRSEYSPWVVSQRVLALKYGICQQQVSTILRGEHWKTVPGKVFRKEGLTR